ncbi:DNA polymerase delta small subunit-like isoform X1 [Zingiber officinale]|uniref:DNA polymerase delta small subunit-like isoform X1 n=2 Tax=Zingiber officinale TaxID=94328 RepID=UPI001C4ACD40|nr:DNA polymerase delta small subunit-like isoform X1 [Zingiber officinale]
MELRDIAPFPTSCFPSSLFPTMRADVEMNEESSKLFEREQAIYNNLDERFEIHKEKYKGQQYSHIYFSRLHHMRNLLYSLVPNWKPNLPVKTILGLEEGKECIIVGTIYKHMKLKPSILDEYSKERSKVPLVKPHNFVHPDDHLILEDESGRVTLTGSLLDPSAFVTGIVVALHGKETSEGDFFVEDMLEAGIPPQTELPLSSIQCIKNVTYVSPLQLGILGCLIILAGEDKYVVFVSGLSIGSSIFNPLQFQLLVDHITGHLGDRNEQSIASQIVHVVVAGNSVQIPQVLLSGHTIAPRDQSTLTEPIKELDILLNQLVAAMPVDIMPGPNDPANFSLPQQPLNRCLFPGASAYNTFMSCTNPHQFELDDILFLGTSGQNIDDLFKYSEAKNRLEFLEKTLKWRHLVPTAPNTVGCYPFTDRDPFLIESCPHVYFIGNQDKYETTLVQGPEKQLVRLICIPKFCETGNAVVLNLRNLECHTLSFPTSLDL